MPGAPETFRAATGAGASVHRLDVLLATLYFLTAYVCRALNATLDRQTLQRGQEPPEWSDAVGLAWIHGHRDRYRGEAGAAALGRALAAWAEAILDERAGAIEAALTDMADRAIERGAGRRNVRG